MSTDKIDGEYTFRRHARSRMGFRKYYTAVVAGNTVRILAGLLGLVFLPFYLINLLGEFLCSLSLRYSQVTAYFHSDWLKAFEEFRDLEEAYKKANK